MRKVSGNEELSRLHASGVGLIYNDFSRHGVSGQKYNVLHAASCDWILKSNVNVPKYFFEDLDEAVAWLTANRGPEGANWRRCGTCGARVAQRASRHSTIAPPLEGYKRSGIFTEQQVEDILVDHLRARGHQVRTRVSVESGIVDIVASDPQREWLIEVKGEDKGGYTSAEMNFQVGIGQVAARMNSDSKRYALAVPLTSHFRRVLQKYRGSLAFRRLGLTLFVVKDAGEVECIDPRDVRSYLDLV